MAVRTRDLAPAESEQAPGRATRVPGARSSARLEPAFSTGSMRPRLLAALAHDPTAQLIVIIGGPGTGKTMLLKQWRASAPGRFLSVTQAEAATNVVEPATVIVDDGDHPAVLGRIEALVAARLPLRFLMAARSLPAVNIAHSEFTTVVLGHDALRFRDDEVKRLFLDHYRLPLTMDDLGRLTRYTGGWAAALELARATIVGVPPQERSGAIARMPRRARSTRTYIDSQVLRAVPEPVLDLLRLCAPLDILTNGSCRSVLGRETDRDLFALEVHVPLVVSSEATGAVRLHPTLRHHLLARERELTGDASTDARLRAAAATHEAAGDLGSAARTLVLAQDFIELRALAARARRRLLDVRPSDWVEDLPEGEVATSPWLMLTRAVRRLHEGRLTLALADAQAARDAFALHPEPMAELEESGADDVAMLAMSWLGAGIGWSDRWEVWLRSAFSNPLVPRPALVQQRRAGEAVVLMTVQSALSGDLVQARKSLGSWAADDDDHTCRIVVQLASCMLNQGRDHELWQIADDAEALGLAWLARAARLLTYAPEYAAGLPENDPLQVEIEESDRLGDPWGAALACALRAAWLLRAHQVDIPALESLCDRFRALDAAALEAWARAGLALGTASIGLPEAFRDAESALALAVATQVNGAQVLAHVALARAIPERRDALLALARAEAATSGFDLQPWTWMDEHRLLEHGADDDTPPLTVRCFAGFEILVQGVAPSLQRVRPRAREALRLLALHAGASVHREVMLDSLWPELDPAAATHNLHVAISSLRTTLEPGVPRGASQLLVRQDERYQLALPPGSRCDLFEFDHALLSADSARRHGDLGSAAEWLRQAVELYRGDVLPEDGPAEWVVEVRDRYRVRAGDAAGELADLRLILGETRLAVAAAQRSIEINPWRDASWRILITAQRAAGDVAAEVVTRADYEAMLASLGLERRSIWGPESVIRVP